MIDGINSIFAKVVDADSEPRLLRHSDGYWYVPGGIGDEKHPSTRRLAYPEGGNEELFNVEDSSFWFAHRSRVITSLLRQFPPAGDIYDIGGGNGHVASALARAGFPAVLVEPGARGVRNGITRGLRSVIRATSEELLFAQGTLPAIGLFDVLEHIENDRAFLRTIRDLLIDEGLVYLTVPAFSWLWSENDTYAQHFRRYTRPALVRGIQSAGFKVLFSSYFFSGLVPPIGLFRTLPERIGVKRRIHPERTQREHGKGSMVAKALARSVLWPELQLLKRGIGVPVGASCCIVARKVTKSSCK